MNKKITVAMAYLATILMILMVVGFAHGIFDAVEASLIAATVVTGVAVNAVWEN